MFIFQLISDGKGQTNIDHQGTKKISKFVVSVVSWW